MSDTTVVEIVILCASLMALVLSSIAIGAAMVCCRIALGLMNIVERHPQRQPETRTGPWPGQTSYTQTASPVKEPTTKTPDLPPEAIAPRLQKPPKPKGGFGSRVGDQKEDPKGPDQEG